jgi:crotonobetainyl-CoA:carnitine CoA-transferase CaiB-like acyl-CoA transferase
MGSAHPTIVPYQCFEARDRKYFTVAVGNDGIWRNFCKATQLEVLIEDQRFATNPKRVENRHELLSQLVKIFLTKDRDDWIDLLRRERVPCGPVYTVDEIFQDPQILHRNMRLELKHPKAGNISQIGSPLRFSEAVSKTWTAPPLLGQHNEEILRDLLRYTPQEINQLKTNSII